MEKTDSVLSLIAKINANANKIIIKESKKYGLEGLCPSHGNILIALYKNRDGVMMNELSKFTHKDKSTITALVNKLEKMGLISKAKSKKDTRSTIVKLTKKGEESESIVLGKISKNILDVLYKDFTQSEKTQLLFLLKKLDTNVLP